MFSLQAEEPMDLRGATWFRLSTSGGASGLACDRDGAAVGPIPLLIRERTDAGEDNLNFGFGLRAADANSDPPLTALSTFYFTFRQYGPMDYQRTGSDGPFISAEGKDRFDGRYTAFSSFNFGLVAWAAGVPLSVALAAAGGYNQQKNPRSDDLPSGNPRQNEENIKLGY
jgi:hypothetical protein